MAGGKSVTRDLGVCDEKGEVRRRSEPVLSYDAPAMSLRQSSRATKQPKLIGGFRIAQINGC